MFEKFSSIEGFHLIRRDIGKNPYVDETKTFTYRGKIKLHGTNGGVCITPHGKVIAQKRTSLIDVSNDNYGFAAWVEKNKDYFKEISLAINDNVYIFGEWCGPGIQKSTAVSQIPNKIFAVFAIQFGASDNENSRVIIHPENIEDFLCGTRPAGMYILPWYTNPLDVCYVNKTSLETAAKILNTNVEDVEKCDPWVKNVFDIENVGEGLVYYPVSEMDNLGMIERRTMSSIMFKAKGEKHQVNKQKNPVIINSEEVKSAKEFVEKFVTDNRLEQGLQEGSKGEFSHKMVGPFLGWVSKDVKKESVAEIKDSGLDWKFLQKYVTTRAREWYLDKLTNVDIN